MTTFCSNNIAQARLADYRRRPVSAGQSNRPARPGGPGRGPWLAEPSGGSGCRGARLVQTVAVRVASRLVRAVSRLGDERSPGPQALASGLERKTPSPNLKTRRPKKNTNTTPHTPLPPCHQLGGAETILPGSRPWGLPPSSSANPRRPPAGRISGRLAQLPRRRPEPADADRARPDEHFPCPKPATHVSLPHDRLRPRGGLPAGRRRRLPRRPGAAAGPGAPAPLVADDGGIRRRRAVQRRGLRRDEECAQDRKLAREAGLPSAERLRDAGGQREHDRRGRRD